MCDDSTDPEDKKREIAVDAAAAKLILGAAETAARKVLESERVYAHAQAQTLQKTVEKLSEDVDKLRGTLTMFAPKPDVQHQVDVRIAALERTFGERVREGERVRKRWTRRYMPTLIAFVLALAVLTVAEAVEVHDRLANIEKTVSDAR